MSNADALPAAEIQRYRAEIERLQADHIRDREGWIEAHRTSTSEIEALRLALSRLQALPRMVGVMRLKNEIEQLRAMYDGAMKVAAFNEAKDKAAAFEEAAKIKRPPVPRHDNSARYGNGWQDGIHAFRAAIRAKAKEVLGE